MRRVIILCFALFLGFTISCKSSKEIKAENQIEFEATKTLVTSKNYKFEADWATPLGNDVANIGMSLTGGAAVFQGNRVNLIGNPNFVKITSEKADLFLPYFGRVFFPKRIGNKRGIVFNGDIIDYEVSINEKKQQIIVNFEAKPEDDYLKLNYVITADRNTRLTVSSSNRQTISYTGRIEAIEESIE